MKLETYGEPAFVNVARKVKEISKVTILLKHIFVDDHQPNDTAERVVREFQKQLRVTDKHKPRHR